MIAKVPAIISLLLPLVLSTAVTAHACSARVDVHVHGDGNQVNVQVIPSPDGTGTTSCNDAIARNSYNSFWTHNGSLLGLVVNGLRRRFVYVAPRDGLTAVGVTGGMAEFEGRRIGGHYEGTAYVFSKTCGPISYSVAGFVSDSDRLVTLTGYAPYVDLQCRISGGRDAILVFENVE